MHHADPRTKHAMGRHNLFFFNMLRMLNIAAHRLARECFSLVSAVWRGVSPDCIREALCNDIMFIDQ
jgi:hypothetical protein